MNQVTNDGFIVIDGQVAMPEETAAELLNLTIDELRRASRAVGIKNSQGGIYVHNGKYYYSSHGILFKVRDINGKKSADLSTRGLIKLFQSAEERLLPQEEFKAKRRKEQIQVVILIVIIGFFIHSCFSSDSEPKNISAPPPVQTPAPVQQSAPVEEKSSSEWANLPETFSATPSIGATRAEFEKYHYQNASNGVGDIRYDNDEYLVSYINANGKSSESKDARIFVLTIQAVEGKTYDLNLFIPSDCDSIEITEDYKDNMMIAKTFKGHSLELEKVFPKYGGEFGYSFVLDAKTNSFISATFTAFP